VDRKKLPAPAQGKIEANACGTTPRDMLEQQLVKIWEKILCVRPVGLTDNFFELGGHSLIAVRLSSEIKKLTGKSLPLATLFQAPTVGQLARILRRDGWSPQWQSLVSIQPEGSRPPLYCVHGGGGNVLFYRDLARHLGSDYPFYGLQCRGLDGNGKCLTRVEDMASAYLKEIRELQPEGPYYLGGFCMGGSIGFEMAQQLTKEGQRVALLAMFDSYNHNGISPRRSIGNRISYLRQKVEFHFSNVLQLAPKDQLLYLADKFKGAKERELARFRLKASNVFSMIGLGIRKEKVEGVLEGINERAGVAYKPQVYPGKVTLFLPRKNYSFHSSENMGWGNVTAGGLEVVELPVNPGGMFAEPYVRLLAARLKTCLDGA
jgi:thioesterase domain-containing protein/acyl carrier protein